MKIWAMVSEKRRFEGEKDVRLNIIGYKYYRLGFGEIFKMYASKTRGN